MLVRKLTSAIVLSVFFACSRPDPAVPRFRVAKETASKAVTGAVASTYIYRLTETPEEHQIQELLQKLRARQAQPADFERGVQLERDRRARYIDGLDTDIGAARESVAQLTTAANTIRDSELRDAARALARHYQDQLERCVEIAVAQRTRSVLTERFSQTWPKRGGLCAIPDLKKLTARPRRPEPR